MKYRHLGFGIFLLSLGVLLLLINVGIISWTIFESIFELWPALLIVAGINVIFRHNEIVKALTWLALLAVVVFYGIYYNGGSNFSKPGWSSGSSVKYESKAGVEYGEIKLALGGTRLNVDSTNTDFVNATLSNPDVMHKIEDRDGGKKQYVSFDEKKIFGINFDKGGDDARFSLNDGVIWNMDVDTGAVAGTIDMSNLKVEKMDMDVGAANLTLILGDKYKSTDLDIDAGASNIDITVPKNTGVKVKMDAALTDTNLKNLGWNRSGNYYISPNYDSSDVKVNMDVDMGAGKFDINVR
jgi:hypothetical protein